MTWLNRQHGIHIGLFILLILAFLLVLAPRMAQGAVEGRTAIEVGKLIPPNGDTAFGWSVALDDRTAVVSGTDVAYVFVEDASGRWIRQANLPGFGGPVALDGDTGIGLYCHTYGGDVVTSVDEIRTVMCGGLTLSK